MKRVIFFSIFAVIFMAGATAQAQMMEVDYGGAMPPVQVIDEQTAREETQGKMLMRKLRNNELLCSELNDEAFGVMGEYMMGAMMGGAHSTMNAMMARVHGQDGAEQIHRVMGKRLSECDPSAALPSAMIGWMPMMSMMIPDQNSSLGIGMMGAGLMPFLGNNNSTTSMMNAGFWPLGFLGILGMIVWWVLIIVLIAALVRWVIEHTKRSDVSQYQSALDILKERYAKGEIDRKEFETKKKDLE